MNNISFPLICVVALGGALGATLRFVISSMLKNANFPLGTFLVNLAGCYLIGLLSGIIINNYADSPNLKLFVITGMLGAFTTFSTFALEGVELYMQSRYFYFFLFSFIQVVMGLFMVIAGRQSAVYIAG